MGNSNIAKIDNKTLRILAQEGEKEVKKGLVFENKLLLTKEEDKMFACMDWMQVKGGSSPSLQFMLHIPTKTKWVCKCSALSIIRMKDYYNIYIDTPTDPINEYKEMLALRLYSFFGVHTPQTVLSKQIMSNSAKKVLKPVISQFPKMKSQLGLEVPRTHILSRLIKECSPLGNIFSEEYGKINRQFCCIKENIRLMGFGRALAVATLLYDNDCVGICGENMGYIIDQNGQAIIVKISAEEALSFLDHFAVGSNKIFGKRNTFHQMSCDIFINIFGAKITFKQLTTADKKQYIEAIQEILEVKDEAIEFLFQEFIKLDLRFKKILKCLLARKKDFLKAFSSDVAALLCQQMQEVNRQLNSDQFLQQLRGEKERILLDFQ